ncbi:MAG: AAA family ATPase [Candidatus Dormibacteraeota bacterium]|nr:AAA family ATPase [Candidatus Dormibacteraeota bacterium]
MKRLISRIPRLDTILGGGLPVGSLIVVAGAPGTGKTILAQQICFGNGTSARKAIYYSTVSEPPEKFITHLKVFEFFDRRALADKVEFINLGDMLQGEGGLDSMMDEIVRKCVKEHPSVVVVDSAKSLRDFSTGGRSLREAVYQLAARIAHTDTTLLFVGEYNVDEIESAPELSIADGILELVYEAHEPMDRRWLRVQKLRGSKHLSGKHPFLITAAGINIFVRAETLDESLQEESEARGRISIGVIGLDKMTHGGLPRGGSTLVLGPSGCGKTALALRFVVQGLEAGERSLYVTFQENAKQLIRKAAGFGWDLKPHLESGQLKIVHVAETTLDLDYIASVVRDEIALSPLHRMVIDSLAEMVVAARESERFSAFARSLLGSLRAAQVSVLTTSETSSLGPTPELLGGLSFLYHNVVLLRYIEQASEVGRAVAILKMRNSDHEKGLWTFAITGRGFVVQTKVESVTGLLGWSVLRDQDIPK